MSGLMRRLTGALTVHRPRLFRQRLQLAEALDVEALDADFERAAHLVGPLADAGEDDLLRVAAGGQHAFEFADGDDIETATGLRKRLQHRQRRVGFHRIADEVAAAGERARVRRQRVAHRGARIDEQRRAVCVRERIERMAFEFELRAAPGEERRAGQRGRRAHRASAPKRRWRRAAGARAASTGPFAHTRTGAMRAAATRAAATLNRSNSCACEQF